MKSEEAIAGLSEIRQPMKRFKGLRIGSWNVLSLYRSKSLQMLLDQLEKYYVDITCVHARKLGKRNWRNAARNRDSWQKILKKALAQKGLLCR